MSSRPWKAGRKPVTYIPQALSLIEQSEHYLSFFQIVKKLELIGTQPQSLRRALVDAEKEGRVIRVGVAPDGSHAWVKAPRTGDKLADVAKVAAHAVYVFIDRTFPVEKSSLDLTQAADGIRRSITTEQKEKLG